MSSKELARFTASGKTFFFNQAEASNGSPFLSINAMWGRGNRQRLTMFPSQMLEFQMCFRRAMQEMTGLQEAPTASANGLTLPIECPRCSTGSADWEIAVLTPAHWILTCSCGEEIYRQEP